MKVNKKTGLLIRFVERAKLENITLRGPVPRSPFSALRKRMPGHARHLLFGHKPLGQYFVIHFCAGHENAHAVNTAGNPGCQKETAN